MRQIDYIHEHDGVLYQGTFTDCDTSNGPDVTWVYPIDGREETHTHPIDIERFEYLWSVVTEHELFRRCPMRRDYDGVDTTRYHVIGSYVQREDDEHQRIYLVAADESDPEFTLWLLELNGPWM